MRTTSLLAVLASFILPGLATPARAWAQDAEVRAILFYSPTCPHCHDVMDRYLPPILERFGDRLQVITINAATPDGGRLYQDMLTAYAVPRERLGVPALVVGGRLLVGSQEIPAELPAIVEAGLAAGGIDWPAVTSIQHSLARSGMLRPRPAIAPEAVPTAAAADPDVSRTLSAAGAGTDGTPRGAAQTETDAAAGPAVPGPAPAPGQAAPAAGPGTALVDLTADAAPATVRERFLRDPVGNGVAVVVLLGLLAVLAWSLAGGRRRGAVGRLPAWLIPSLVVAGATVAAYMSFVEVTGAEAACGPVGDCNTVQHSPYATLFGFLPVGVLGLAGYAAMGILWAVGRSGSAERRRTGTLLLWAAAVLGTAFSAYLTFLEPFVIGATCVWCLTSAVLIAVILMAATVELRQARLPAGAG
jgi:uncharacterized membrane protein